MPGVMGQIHTSPDGYYFDSKGLQYISINSIGAMLKTYMIIRGTLYQSFCGGDIMSKRLLLMVLCKSKGYCLVQSFLESHHTHIG